MLLQGWGALEHVAGAAGRGWGVTVVIFLHYTPVLISLMNLIGQRKSTEDKLIVGIFHDEDNR